MIDKDRATAGGVGTIDVAPAITDEKTLAQVDPMRRGRALEHSGRRLSAITWIAMSRTAVKTDFNPIERRKDGPELHVHCFNYLARLRPAAHIRLVRHHDKEEPGIPELLATLDHVRIQLEIVEPCRWIGKSVPDHGPVEHSIPIQKDGAFSYFVLSHFVWAALSAGCETKRCQTTA